MKVPFSYEFMARSLFHIWVIYSCHIYYVYILSIKAHFLEIKRKKNFTFPIMHRGDDVKANGLWSGKNCTTGSFECRSATGREFKTCTKQQVYIFIIHRSSWIVNRNTNIWYRFWHFHCGQFAKLGKRHYVAASYKIASNQSVTKCLLMRLFFLKPVFVI